MNIKQFLDTLAPLDPAACKLHLACRTSKDEPIEVYHAGRFKQWQEDQNQRNFERPLILSLIQMAERGTWLFAGVYKRLGCEASQTREGCWNYRTEEVAEYAALNGRVVVAFVRPGRQSYLRAERWIEQVMVRELLARKLAIPPFPGYRRVCLTKPQLDTVVTEGEDSWRVALSAVAGVYAIADSNSGKLYIGSAYGEGGFWSRWSSYSTSGHGGNTELKAILRSRGLPYAKGFVYSILEVCDGGTPPEEVMRREAFWKRALLSREFGYNGN